MTKLLTEIQQDIAELRKISKGNKSNGTTWHDGRIDMAKQALSVIERLRAESYSNSVDEYCSSLSKTRIGLLALKSLSLIERLQEDLADVKKRAADEDMNRQFQIREKVLDIIHLQNQLQIAVNCLKLFASTGHVDAITTLNKLENHGK